MLKKLMFGSAAAALLSTTAFAADLPSRRAPAVFVPPPALFTWTGLEAGLHSAYTFTNDQTVNTTGTLLVNQAALANGSRAASVRMDDDGFAQVGGDIAYNYQFTPGSGVVIGAKADFDWTDLRKYRGIAGPANFGTLTGFNQKLEYLGTVNGRIGYAFDRFLVYGTGGFAFGEVSYTGGFTNPGPTLAYFGQYKGWDTGYDFGGGVEYAIPPDSFLNNLSIEHLLGLDKALGIAFEGTIKLEFIHYDLGSRNVLIAAQGAAVGSYVSRFKTEGNMIRAGLGYKFGGDATPVVARY